jgi:hypothetical protein
LGEVDDVRRVVHDQANIENELFLWSEFSSCISSGWRNLLTIHHIQIVFFRLGKLVESLLVEDDVSFQLPAPGVQESRYSSPKL